jgi:hypothetical protein
MAFGYNGWRGPSGTAIILDPGEPAPNLPEPQVTEFVWRGSAESRDEALRAALAAWADRYGTTSRRCRTIIREIEPGDSGYPKKALGLGH